MAKIILLAALLLTGCYKMQVVPGSCYENGTRTQCYRSWPNGVNCTTTPNTVCRYELVKR